VTVVALAPRPLSAVLLLAPLPFLAQMLESFAGHAAVPRALGLAIALLPLQTRLRDEGLLTGRWRKRLYDIIQANPGISLKELTETAGMSLTNARYHLELLKRHELVREFQVLHRLCYAPTDSNPSKARAAAFLRADPKLHRLQGHLTDGPRRATELVEALRNDMGLSRSGGWKLLDRAEHAGLIEKRLESRRLVVRSKVVGEDEKSG
jgi:predicted transcriptional regulator